MQSALEVAKRLNVMTERSMAIFFDTAVQQGPNGAKSIAEAARTALLARGSNAVPYADVLRVYVDKCLDRVRRRTPPTEDTPGTWRIRSAASGTASRGTSTCSRRSTGGVPRCSPTRSSPTRRSPRPRRSHEPARGATPAVVVGFFGVGFLVLLAAAGGGSPVRGASTVGGILKSKLGQFFSSPSSSVRPRPTASASTTRPHRPHRRSWSGSS